MTNILVYECGAMSALLESNTYEQATEWRQYAKSKLKDSGIRVFDPTENSLEHYNYPPDYDYGVVLQNYTYLQKSDILLVSLDHIEDSIGSLFELCMAWTRNITVIAFGTCKKFYNRPHFKALITVQVDTVEDACDYIISMFGYKL